MNTAKDHNWIKANLTTKVIDGKTWVLMDDKVYDALRASLCPLFEKDVGVSYMSFTREDRFGLYAEGRKLELKGTGLEIKLLYDDPHGIDGVASWCANHPGISLRLKLLKKEEEE